MAKDAVSSSRTVASFCAEEKVMELYKKKCEAPIKAGIRQGIISGIGFGLSFFLLFSVYACSFYAGAKLVGDGKTSFSDVFRVSHPPYHFILSELLCFGHFCPIFGSELLLTYYSFMGIADLVLKNHYVFL